MRLPDEPTSRPPSPEVPSGGPTASLLRPLDAAGQARVEQYRRLAYRIAWGFVRHQAGSMPAEELLSEAVLGLIHAIRRFDESRKVPFPPYASLVIRHHLRRAILRWRRDSRPLSISLGSDDRREIEIPQSTSDPVSRIDTEDLYERVRQSLSDRLFLALHLYHAEGRTFDEIGVQMGISRQRVRQLVVRATEEARHRFGPGVA